MYNVHTYMYCYTNPAAVNPTLTLADLVHSTRVTGWGGGKGWGGGMGGGGMGGGGVIR